MRLGDRRTPLADAGATTKSTSISTPLFALSDFFLPTTSNVVGSAAGAASGGLIGGQFGKSSGSAAATITGILASRHG